MSETHPTLEDTTKTAERIATFSLETILSDKHETIEHPGPAANGVSPTGWDEEMPEIPVAEGFCVECEGEFCVIFSKPLTQDLASMSVRSACTSLV